MLLHIREKEASATVNQLILTQTMTIIITSLVIILCHSLNHPHNILTLSEATQLLSPQMSEEQYMSTVSVLTQLLLTNQLMKMEPEITKTSGWSSLNIERRNLAIKIVSNILSSVCLVVSKIPDYLSVDDHNRSMMMKLWYQNSNNLLE